MLPLINCLAGSLTERTLLSRENNSLAVEYTRKKSMVSYPSRENLPRSQAGPANFQLLSALRGLAQGPVVKEKEKEKEKEKNNQK